VGTLALSLGVGLAVVEREARRTRDANSALAQSNTRLAVANETLATANADLNAEKGRAFITALNKRLAVGVTPENNAAVLIWQALGPQGDAARVPPQYFAWLGIARPPERGDYFISFERYVEVHLKADPKAALGELDYAQSRPWTTKKFPVIASWLEIIEGPLALVIQATKRPHYYSPVVPEESGTLLDIRIPTQEYRRLAGALLARAMLRASQGARDDAWQDLLACHRLARLLGQSGTLIECLISFAIDRMASLSDLAYLARTEPDARHVARCLNDLRRLPPLPDIVDRISLCDRFMALESVTMPEGNRIDLIKKLYRTVGPRNDRKRAEVERFLNSVTQQDVDWDATLGIVNRWYDRAVGVMRVTNLGLRAKELLQIESEAAAMETSDPKDLLAGDALANGKVMGSILLDMLYPRVSKVQQAADRALQNQENLRLAFALAWFRREHGSYPKRLDELAPKYVSQIHPDSFSGRALVYQPSGDGYLLYSTGVNGKDEGGRGFEDNPPGDDLSVRMPLPALPPQK
jgi:hypothetical protein